MAMDESWLGSMSPDSAACMRKVLELHSSCRAWVAVACPSLMRAAIDKDGSRAAIISTAMANQAVMDGRRRWVNMGEW